MIIRAYRKDSLYVRAQNVETGYNAFGNKVNIPL